MDIKELVAEIQAVLDKYQAIAATEIRDEEYDERGFSHETSFGCRRHRIIDEMIANWLKNGDADHIEAADTMPRWFGFSPTYYPDLQSNNPEDVELVRAAYNRSFYMTFLGNDSAPFSTRTLGPVPQHQIVLYNDGDAVEWIKKFAEQYKDYPDRIRQVRERAIELGEGRPRPSPLPPGWSPV